MLLFAGDRPNGPSRRRAVEDRESDGRLEMPPLDLASLGALFAGTIANFESGSGGTQLSDSGGPGFRFLTIIDTQQLSGKIIFVRREVGSANSQFTLTVE
jgi:hypothetical protein